jgi:hypothetical protein
MHEFTLAHPDWLTVVQMSAYAPDLNPEQGLWANTKNALGNLTACTTDQLAAVIRTGSSAPSTGPRPSTASSARPGSALNL